MAASIAALVALVSAGVAAARAGDLDPTFSGNGWVLGPFGGMAGGARDLAIQPDGRIVAVGEIDEGGHWGTAVVRYMPDGSVDETFGDRGTVFFDFETFDEVRALVAYPNGKLLVVGTGWCRDGSCFGLARLMPDGELDRSFDADGVVNGPFFGLGHDAALDARGRIVMVGVHDDLRYNNNTARFAIARYRRDGRLDTTFSDDGRRKIDFGYGNEHANSVALADDGRIVVAGFAKWSDNVEMTLDFALARLMPDGRLDRAFSRDGRRLVDFGPSHDQAWGVALYRNGGIVATGDSARRIALARLRPDGALDDRFGNGGRRTLTIETRESGATGVVRTDSGIVVAGTSVIHRPTEADWVLARFTERGRLDRRFGDGGIVVADFGDGWHGATSVARQADGKLVAAGIINDSIAIARFLA